MRKIVFCACTAAVAASAAWAADVTVAGLNAPNGALAVDAGTTVLTNGFTATLPSALADAAALWFAADANVIADENGGVTEWRDVREAANAETRLYSSSRRTGRTARRAGLPPPPRSSTTRTSRRRTAARWRARAAARSRSSSRSTACSPTRSGVK